MQNPEWCYKTDRAQKNTRVMLFLVSALTALVCTACNDQGQSADDREESETAYPLPPVTNRLPLSEDEWENTLGRVLEVIGTDTRQILLDVAVALQLPGSSGNVSEEIVPTGELVDFMLPDGTSGMQETASCVAGGEFTLASISSDSERVMIDADECVLDSWLISGNVERVTSTTVMKSLTFHEFSVEVGNQRLNVPAALYEYSEDDPYATRLWKGMSYSVEENLEVTAVHDLEWESVDIYGTAFDQLLSMSFIANGPWTNGQPLSVTTPVPFGGLTTSETGRDYSSGRLVVESMEGNRLMLDVDGVEAGLVAITLESGGVITTHIRPRPAVLR